jgi:long-chain acyl-CoA synthetase
MSAVPFYHANGFDNSLSLPLLSGATVVLQTPCAVSHFLKTMAEQQIQVLIGSPAIFELMVRDKARPRAFAAMEICASSGGPLATEVIEAFRERYSVVIRQVYGSTETAEIAVNPEAGGSSLVSVPGVSVAIINSEGRLLPAHEEGEIAVQGPAVVSGYVGDPDGTARAFTNGYDRTGDLGFLDAAGRLTLLGRLRPMINLSGTKVDPIEIEGVLSKLAGVNACKVLSELGPRKSQILKAVVAVQEGSTLARADIIGHCRQRLAEYKIPRIIKIVPALPEDWTGKDSILWGHARE